VNTSTAQAKVMVDELIRCGVSDVVVAPGSRSAALAIAFAEAEVRGEIVLHVRLDERTAGFLALGLGKVSGVPAVVLTTSGTAAVNLHPAIIEADLSNVPLIALTADRPPTLRDIGANQAIDQLKIFGPSVRTFHEMAMLDPVRDPVAANRYWRSTIARAVAAATDGMRPGPVHLNAPFSEPLVPDSGGPDSRGDLVLEGRSDGRPWTADSRMVAGMSTPLDHLLETLLGDPVVPARGVIVVGDHDDAEAIGMIDELADAIGWPVIGEPSGNVAGCDTVLSHGGLLLADEEFAAGHLPDVVMTVGRVGLSRAVMRMVTRAGLHIAVDADPQWADPGRSADVVVASVPLPPEEAEVDEEWLASWQRADLLAAAAVETALAAEGAVLTGMHVARATAAAVLEGGMFYVGPSWPVRHVFNFASTTVSDGYVLGNRGTSGIDGCLSTAWGAASAFQRQEGVGAVALVGDLTFLYDSNALLVPDTEDEPDLVIVVADNNGGGIFSQLEQGEPRFAPVFDRVFGVPLSVDIVGLAQTMAVPAVAAETLVEFEAAIGAALEAGGVRVVVAKTCEREREAGILASVQRAVHEALGSA
jgi:2-succinyl-5-enolpyruvyl-6-hydroxy-3-cyclohexene-1-carboxylate synthase